MSQKRTRRSASQWQMLVDQQADSDLSASVFCQRKQINYQRFCHWRHKLQSPQPAEQSLVDVSSLFSSPSGATDQWHIELDLGNGIKLNLSQR